MRTKSASSRSDAKKVVKDFRRANQHKFSTEGKIRTVIESIAQSLDYGWLKEFLETGKKRLSGDTEHEANTA